MLSVLFSTVPAFNITALAASVTYYETSEDNVPLRNAKGSENTTVSKISKKGTVVKLIKSEKNWTSLITWTNWHKVQVASGTTNNGLSGDYWLWNGNVNKHKHSLSAGACTANGCDYAETIETIDNEKMTMEVKEKTSAVRKAPYNDGEMVADLKKGDLVSVTNKVKNYKGSYWYKLSSGDYIYSGNVKKASAKTEAAASNSFNNSGGSSSGGSSSGGSSSSGSSGGANSGYFTPPQSISLPCTHINWNVGKCVNCGKDWTLIIEPVTGTYEAKENGTVARDIPYKQGIVKRTYQKDDIVSVVGRAKNSAKNTWYQTSDGYWIYGVEEVTLQSVYLSTTNYTFKSMDDSVTPSVNLTPKNASATKSWSSSNDDVATVNKTTGKITPVGVGKATITCTITATEGTVKKATVQVVVTEEAALETWDYSSTVFEYDLALECSTYSSLAYPDYNYSYDNGKPIVFKTSSSSKTPNNLTKLLSERKFNYEISNNYHNKTRNNSPYVLAHKNVKYSGKKTPLVYVIIEGTAGKPGWEGNMMITGTSYDSSMINHKTFESSASDIKSGLDSYIKSHNLSSPLVVITGHSRGAAAGNLLAEKLNKSSSYKKVYAYLFATPNTTKNPVAYSNVYNICNESDFVPYIPLSSTNWGYEKHGKMYSFDSAFLSTGSYGSHFNNYSKNEFKRSEYSRNPDYNWYSDTTDGMRDYMKGKWKNTGEYYKHNTNTYTECNIEAYDYFYNGLAPAASGGSKAVLMDHLHVAWTNCPFGKISWFFAGNAANLNKITNSFRDSHEMMTYHAAMLSRDYNSGNKAYIFSDVIYGNDTIEINPDEYDALYSFFSQSENELMLEVAGWDIEDASTWEGIKWNTDGNVVSIDLSYLNLSGWFNANNFPKLQDLNIDGNSLTMLAVSECSELVNLSCMSNNLSSLAVNECGSLQNLDCGFNQISSLDVSNMSQLSELNCYGNQINDLDLSGASALQTVRCGNNELYTVDISTNTSLNTFYCDNNNIVESQNTELLNSINAINANGGSAIIGTQKYNENYTFNTAELSSLTEFANMSLNLEKLGWDLDDPYTWQGVEWKIIGGEYHITSINFDGLELEGDFNLPEAEYVESVSCENSSLTTLNLAGCTSLSSVNCYNSGISSLEIENCSSLSDINCDENYLEIEDVESSLSQIGLSTGIATYETQNIAADEETFNQVERDVLIAFLSTGTNADVLGWDWNWPGTWDGIVWTNADGEYHVNKIDFGDKDVCGDIDLSAFEYLEDFDFSGSQIETVVLPNCITKIPEYAFYNSGIKYIHMSEGVTNIEKSAFSYCDDLNTIVLPSTVTRIMDNAFYESKNLKNLVFIGNEPAEVGVEIAHGTSSEFNIIFFNDSTWNGATGLLNDYSYITKEDNYIVMLDEDIELKDDTYYSETNNYAGDDINVTIISKTPGASATCLLSVYDELGGFNELASVSVDMNRYMTVTTFEDINVQYVGEEFCTLKAFLWGNIQTLKPITKLAEKVLIKPLI